MSGLLVVAHEGTRTGSPTVLLHLLRHLRRRWSVPVAVDVRAEGPLAAPLRALGDGPPGSLPPAVVWVNSALAAAAAWEHPAGVPVVVYVHEQGEALDRLDDRARSALAERADRVWCVNDAAGADLVRLGVDPVRLEVVPPVVVVPDVVDPGAGAALVSRLDLDPGRPLVVACGEAGWRKGADLFLDVCRRCAGREDLQFAWVGRRPRAFGRVLDHDTAVLGLAGRLRWTGELADPLPLLAAASVLVLPSREDPQPLVPLEAALVGTPTVAFAVGGVVELATEGAALAVPYPDTAALAVAVERLLREPGTGEALVAAARRRAATRHDLAVVGDRVVASLRELAGDAVPRAGGSS